MEVTGGEAVDEMYWGEVLISEDGEESAIVRQELMTRANCE